MPQESLRMNHNRHRGDCDGFLAARISAHGSAAILEHRKPFRSPWFHCPYDRRRTTCETCCAANRANRVVAMCASCDPKWVEYERRKAKLPYLLPQDYEAECKRIADEMGI